MSLVGYARVSTNEQDLSLQLDALTTAGCIKIFEEEASGTLDERPRLAQMLDYLRPGDVLTVWRLDRLGREGFELFVLVDPGLTRNGPAESSAVLANLGVLGRNAG